MAASASGANQYVFPGHVVMKDREPPPPRASTARARVPSPERSTDPGLRTKRIEAITHTTQKTADGAYHTACAHPV
ncbi:hypothetical protein SRABI128_02568 [Microbacterium sp. Bi128]|nr:hypothetical protein SRABI128_02568 [Microbacterium sp. Bi128]